jgi:hypothetical protein
MANHASFLVAHCFWSVLDWGGVGPDDIGSGHLPKFGGCNGNRAEGFNRYLIEKIRKLGILARLSSRNYAAVPLDHDLPARGKSHPINFWYGSRRNFRDGSRRLRWNPFFWAAVLANAATCSSVCLLSFGRAIHARMIFRRVSWSSMFAVPWLISHLRPPRP